MVPIICVGHTMGFQGHQWASNLAGWAKINGFSATENAIDALSALLPTGLPICRYGFIAGAAPPFGTCPIGAGSGEQPLALDEPNAGLDQVADS